MGTQGKHDTRSTIQLKQEVLFSVCAGARVPQCVRRSQRTTCRDFFFSFASHHATLKDLSKPGSQAGQQVPSPAQPSCLPLSPIYSIHKYAWAHLVILWALWFGKY